MNVNAIESYLLGINPGDFLNKDIAVDDVLGWFKMLDAYWMHDDNSTHPHAKLTSGKCSNGFFDCLQVLSFFNLSEIIANQLARQIRKVIGNQEVDVIVASPMADITFAHDVGRALGAKIFIFVEKDPKDDKKKICRRQRIPQGANVLQIEELITTALTTSNVKAAVELMNGEPVNWLPCIGTMVHRPPYRVTHYDERKVVSVIEKIIWAEDPSECPLCIRGSQPIAPKKGQNWLMLTGKQPYNSKLVTN